MRNPWTGPGVRVQNPARAGTVLTGTGSGLAEWAPLELGGGADLGTAALFIQDSQPADPGPYLWVDTSGGDLAFMVEDGV